MKSNNALRLITVLLLSGLSVHTYAQQITGIWKGRVKSSNLELKIIKSGDSLTGTSYYYSSKNNFRRYSIKGYFDPETNDVIWWDDILLSGGNPAATEAALNVADFNCPGEDKMLLDGNSTVRDNKDISKGPLHLQKINSTGFPDEWDWVIDNYTAGANNPYIIDSIGQLAGGPRIFPEEKLIPVATPPLTIPEKKHAAPVVKAPTATAEKNIASKKPSTNQEKFTSRQNKLQMVIPVTAAVIELRFYDNAAIDGDSIALYLNGHVLREHILLGGEPQVIKINAADLQDDNELVLVAENLGSIPPNTSYLVAMVGHKKFEARLFADEGTSALIRFVKNNAANDGSQ
ncbi:MAG: hypothetical protein ABIQ88_05145 [Chitinophagaceae bacterium]